MAASRTFHRQNFQETKPGAAIIDFVNFLYIKGNPHLKPTYGYNLDFSYQYFWGNSGLITLTAYGKYIYDHIFVESTGGSDPLTLFITKTYENVRNAYVGGVELELKKKFDFLPRFASGFGLGANITYSISRMQIPGRPNSQAMSEQSPLLYNLSLIYEKYGIKSSLALNYNSPFLLEVNLATLPNSKTGDLLHQNSDFDTYMGEQYSLDFQISYEFKKHFSVYLEANNLLNSAYKQYIGNPDRPLYVEYYKQRGQLGFKYEL
jgi:TonB-dependent receptor